jgi:hypothetical protein
MKISAAAENRAFIIVQILAVIMILTAIYNLFVVYLNGEIKSIGLYVLLNVIIKLSIAYSILISKSREEWRWTIVILFIGLIVSVPKLLLSNGASLTLPIFTTMFQLIFLVTLWMSKKKYIEKEVKSYLRMNWPKYLK